MHKNSKLLPYQRLEVYRRWCQGDQVTDLARQYRVTRKTLYEVFTGIRIHRTDLCMRNRAFRERDAERYCTGPEGGRYWFPVCGEAMLASQPCFEEFLQLIAPASAFPPPLAFFCLFYCLNLF